MMGDERVNLRVPEQIEVSYELAGLGSRFLAAVIDTFLSGLIVAVLAAAAWAIRAHLTGQVGVSGITAAIVAGAAILVYVAYHVFFELTREGKPPGKAMTGLRVISVDGSSVAPEQSAVRNILRIVDLLPVSYAIGVIALLVTARNQRLGDLAGGTMVVKERLERIEELPEPEVERQPRPELPPGVTDDVLRLVRAGARVINREEEKTIRRYLDRRYELTPDARRRLAARLAQELRRRFPGLAPGQLRNPETFLEVVIRAIDERSQGR